MTKTKALALIILVAGTLLYLKGAFFSPRATWKDHHQAGVNAFYGKNYPKAERELLLALALSQSFEETDPRRMRSLNDLAEMYRLLGKSTEAEAILRAALDLAETIHGPDNPNVAAYLTNLAENLRVQGRPAEAEPLLKRALVIWEKTLGPEDPMVMFLQESYQRLRRDLAASEPPNPGEGPR